MNRRLSVTRPMVQEERVSLNFVSSFRMTCPKCERSDFVKLQGFVNHCILSHDVRAGSHEEAVRRFGVPVVSDWEMEK
jgi:hypothetical protein